MKPPALARALIARLLPAAWRGSVLSDLADDHERNARERGVVFARLRYWQEVLGAWRVRREHARGAPASIRSRKGSMMTIWTDLRYSARALRATPGYTAVAVLALTLGVGLPTTMFSIVHGAFRDLPFEDGSDIVYVGLRHARQGWDASATRQHLSAWTERQSTFEALGSFNDDWYHLSGGEGRPVRYRGAEVTVNTFGLLRVRPVLGRGFLPSDARAGAEAVVILGHRVWTDRFDTDSTVLGRAVRVNAVPRVVVGVMPPGFRFPTEHDLWVPMPADADLGGPPVFQPVFGRLLRGVELARAQSDLATIATNLSREPGAPAPDLVPVVSSYADRFVGDQARPALLAMLGIVSLVLVIACVNVANLMLAKAVARRRELAIRAALGAGRARIVSLVVTEAFLIAAAGGAGGALLAQVGVALFNRALAPTGGVFWFVVAVDGATFLFALALVAVATAVAGLMPGLQASGNALNDFLQDASRGASGWRLGRITRVLVVGEIAMSFALLVASGLLLKGAVQLNTLVFPLPTDDVLVGEVRLLRADYPTDPDRLTFYRDLRERLQALPGVTSVALASHLPGRAGAEVTLEVPGTTVAAGEAPRIRYARVGPGFFGAFDTAVLRGRDFDPSDVAGNTPVALVNQRFAEVHFPAGEPLGRRFRMRGVAGNVWLTVVGIAPDLYMADFDQTDRNPPAVYLPMGQEPSPSTRIAIRTAGPPLALAPALRDAVEAIDPDMPVVGVMTLKDHILTDLSVLNLIGTLFLAFGVSGLVLAVAGVYGVMSFAVSQRVRELGVRLALGADAGRVLRLVLRQGAAQVATGMVVGLGLAVAIARLMAALFDVFQIDPADFAVYGIIAGVLAAAGMLATFVPARRATRVDPMTALRGD